MAESIRDKVSAEDLQALLADDKREWLEAIDAIYAEFGEAGVREILRNLQDHVLSRNVALDEATLNTPTSTLLRLKISRFIPVTLR